MTSDWLERHTGAYATPTLVGRQDLIAQVMRVLQDPNPQPHILFLMGEGGIGKTRLLKALLELAAQLPGVTAATALIDLYHIQNHTDNGLAEAMYSVLTEPANMFEHYAQALARLKRLQMTGEVALIGEQRREVLKTFSTDLQVLTANQRVVLALDTAERFAYGAGLMPEGVEDIAQSWEWLLRSLDNWQNIVLIVAGRDATTTLIQTVEQKSNVIVEQWDVEPFNEDESLGYFVEIIRIAQEQGDHETAARLAELSPQTRRLCHEYAHGHPIFLALLVDYLTRTGSLPTFLTAGYSARQRWQREEDVAKFEAQIISDLMETAGIGTSIIALGHAPKGVDAALLATILECPIPEAEARLQEIENLTFVKKRPADQRIFLHDRMYELLRREIYDVPEGVAEDKEFIRTILAYYNTKLDQCRQELDSLYAPAEREGKERLDFDRITELHMQRRTLLTEILYYSLRFDAVEGFRSYYRYTREAALSGDVLLDLQLQAELLAFVAEKDPTGEQMVIDGLERELVLGVLAVRSVVRAWAEGNYKAAIDEATKLRHSDTNILAAGAPVTESILDIWEAYSYIYLGGEEDLKIAQGRLDAAISRVRSFREYNAHTDSGSEAARLRVLAVLAFAYRVRGYLQRVRGSMSQAMEDYQESIKLWREVSLLAELATVSNDLGFALVELGFVSDARAFVLDALDIRRRLGHRSLVGLSLNTYARIDLSDGQFEASIAGAERALALFRALGDSRGTGLALITLAEAVRRHSATDQVPEPEKKIDLLRRAVSYAQEAIEIFRQTGETVRQVEALIEEGCAYRDWIRVRSTAPSPRDNIDRLLADGVRALQEASGLAGNATLHRAVDALVNLAWMGFYAERPNLLQDAADRAVAAIPRQYWIEAATGQPPIKREQAQVQVWPQVGKLHTLYGHQAFREYTAKRVKQPDQALSFLTKAAEEYVWSLQYNALYSEDFRDIRKVREEIHARLKTLSATELQIVAGKVAQVETENHLGKSVMRHFLERRALWYD